MSTKKDLPMSTENKAELKDPISERIYEPPEILSFRQDELLPEAKASYCFTTSPACITVSCTGF